MTKEVLGIAGLVCFGGGMISALLMIIFFIRMLLGIKPKMPTFVYFLGPVILFWPPLFDDGGNVARIRLLISAFVFAAFFGGMAFIHSAVNHP